MYTVAWMCSMASWNCLGGFYTAEIQYCCKEKAFKCWFRNKSPPFFRKIINIYLTCMSIICSCKIVPKCQRKCLHVNDITLYSAGKANIWRIYLILLDVGSTVQSIRNNECDWCWLEITRRTQDVWLIFENLLCLFCKHRYTLCTIDKSFMKISGSDLVFNLLTF